MRRPKADSVIWDFLEHKTTPEFSYRVDTSRDHGLDYLRLRYIKNGKDKTKFFFGETAWMDITRFIHDLGDLSFNIDKIMDDLIESYVVLLKDLKGSC